jgi:tRNA threonylcarbamoyladenosine biosynthesis protein TsaB
MPQLAIESSTESCSVALQIDGELRHRQAVEPRAHARLILPWAGELLAEGGIDFADLDSLVVSRGPGGFTSLRIGLGIVQGIALAHDLPVHPVSSLAALAESADPDRRIPNMLALLDARMGEVYAAWYQTKDDRRERLGEESLLPPERLQAPVPGPWLAIGPGARVFGEQIKAALGRDLVDPPDNAPEEAWPTAIALLKLATTVEPVPAHQLTPIYLRDQVTG